MSYEPFQTSGYLEGQYEIDNTCFNVNQLKEILQLLKVKSLLPEKWAGFENWCDSDFYEKKIITPENSPYIHWEFPFISTEDFLFNFEMDIDVFGGKIDVTDLKVELVGFHNPELTISEPINVTHLLDNKNFDKAITEIARVFLNKL